MNIQHRPPTAVEYLQGRAGLLRLRHQIEDRIERLIDVLDAMDGEPDAECDGLDEDDGTDELSAHPPVMGGAVDRGRR